MTRADATIHKDFVSVENLAMQSKTDTIKVVRTMAEDIISTCDRFTASQLSVEHTNAAPQKTTQTEQNQCSERTDCCEQHKAEMDALKSKLKEVVDMNVGWQLLHDQREKHVTELTNRIKELEQRVTSSADGTSDVTEATPVDSNDVESLRCKCTRLAADKRELEVTNQNLREQLESAQDLAMQLEQAVDRLNSDIESVVRDKQSFIDTLQAQILVYREDFECERNDRERAQGKLTELKMELDSLKKRLVDEPVVRRHHQQIAAPNVYGYPNMVEPPYVANGHRYRAAPIVQRPAQYNYYNYGRDEVDCDTASTASQLDELTPRGHVGSDDEQQETLVTDGPVEEHVDEHQQDVKEVLHCPNCKRGFTLSQHVELMDHMDVCS